MSTIYIECPSKPPVTLYQTLVIAGKDPEEHRPREPDKNADQIAWERYRRDLAEHEDLTQRQKEKVMERSTAPLFICGDIEPEPFCKCGHTAELLCDHPMGRGKTCDLHLCWCCTKHIAEETDLCLIHFAEFVKRTGVKHINPWPPPRNADGR